MELLESRLTPTVNFYWKLEANNPIVDPNHDYKLPDGTLGDAQQLYTWSYDGSDGTGGEQQENSSLTISAAPDLVNYSYSLTDSVDPEYDIAEQFNGEWSGAPPNVIMPGESFTIQLSASANWSPIAGYLGVTADAVGLTTHSLSGVELPLDPQESGTLGIDDGETDPTDENGSITFTAPTTEFAYFPEPTGGEIYKPVSEIGIIEQAGLGSTDGDIVTSYYFYQMEIGTPPPPPPPPPTPSINMYVQPQNEVLDSSQPLAGFGLSVKAMEGRKPIANALVTLSIDKDNNPGTGSLSNSKISIIAPTATTNAQGVATFSHLFINNDGDGYKIQASLSSGSSTAITTTNSFNVVNNLPTDVWTGNGGNDLWSTVANWSLGVPVDDQPLDFPDGANRTTNVNDLANLTVASITINDSQASAGVEPGITPDMSNVGSYTYYGSSFNVVYGITQDSGVSNFEMPVQMNQDSLASQQVTLDPQQGSEMNFWDPDTGSDQVTQDGPGTVYFTNDEDKSGVNVQQGTMEFDNSAMSGPLTVGMASSSNAIPAQEAFGGVLPADSSDTVLLIFKQKEPWTGNATLNGGTLAVVGQLVLNGTINVASNTTLESLVDPEFVKTSTITLKGAITGSGTLAVAPGHGVVTLAGALNNTGTSVDNNPVGVEVEGIVQLTDSFNGSSGIEIDQGGLLASAAVGNYTGNVYLDGGTVRAGDYNAYGSGTFYTDSDILGQPYTSNLVCYGTITLDNPINMNGGDLLVSDSDNTKSIVMSGSVTMTSAGEISASKVDSLSLTGSISGTGLLTLAGTSKVKLSGDLDSGVTDSSNVSLGDTFAGIGAIDVPAKANLYASGTSGNYAGTITLDGGTLDLTGSNALGSVSSGIILVNHNSTIVSNKSASLATKNTLTMNGGNLTVIGNLQIVGTIQLNNTTSTSIIKNTAELTLGSITSLASQASLSLSSTSSTAKITLASSLNNSAVNILSNTTVMLGSAFGDLSGGTPGSLEVDTGGKLISDGVTGTFTGNINLVGGKLVVQGSNPFGAATINVTTASSISNGIDKALTINNPVKLGSTLSLSGSLTFISPVVLSSDSQMQVEDGNLSLQGGVFGAFTLSLSGYGVQFYLSGPLTSQSGSNPPKIIVPAENQFHDEGLSGNGTVVDANGNVIWPKS